ncbi:MAG: hypothetical protein CMH54_02920 [Myxococcales bacterium]|nr:hypothetical protein [Myxococcales bacterium]
MLKFRAPGESIRLNSLVARAWPNVSQRQITTTLRKRGIKVGGRHVQDANMRIPPGSLISINAHPGEVTPERVPPSPLETGDDHIAFLIPPGLENKALTEEEVQSLLENEESTLWGEDYITLQPGPGAAGLLVVTRTACTTKYRAIVPHLPYREGVLQAEGTKKNTAVQFRVVSHRDQLTEIELQCASSRSDHIRIQLAKAGYPILGDGENGGIMVDGGLRLWLCHAENSSLSISLEPPERFWPNEPVFLSGNDDDFQVSSATQRILKQGHPWIIKDDDTSDAGRFPVGSRVQIVCDQDHLGTAHIEGPHKLVARLWSNTEPMSSIEDRVSAALAKRKALFESSSSDRPTTAFRLIHGEADGLGGLFIDRLGPVLRVLVAGGACLGFKDQVVQRIREQLQAMNQQDPTVIEVMHLRPRPQGEVHYVQHTAGPLSDDIAEDRLQVQENGLYYWVRPGLSTPTRAVPGVGLFMDQRVNRERLIRLCPGRSRWLNLFCHTGAFSVALLHAGAEHITSVDLSGPYLHWLNENLELNGLSDRDHISRKSDARRYLERLDPAERFDGIILDPPTAAASGRRFWSVKRDVGELIGAALARLNPDGVLLVTRNDRRARGSLAPILREAAQSQRVSIKSLKSAGPSPDFPSLRGFPEGDAFTGSLLIRG